MKKTRVVVAVALLAAALLASAPGRGAVTRAADDWLPIDPAELSMKDYAPSPGAHAVLLYREVKFDDPGNLLSNYTRIKILTEDGKKYANIEVVYVKGASRVTDIKARTIRPDGSILKFDGQVFDKVAIKARGVKVQTKTFTLPDVQVGSIIEYRYHERWEFIPFMPNWDVQHELPTRKAKFWFKPYPTLALSWVTRLPAGARLEEQKSRALELNVENIAPFKEEPHMPPEEELKMRVNFFYFRQSPETPEKYWKDIAKEWHRYVMEEFIGKRGKVREEAQRILSPSDDAETKLRKIYARVQEMRNLSYERDKSEQEAKREKLKDLNNVEDVLKRGYGYRDHLTRLFVSLAQAAGFDAQVIFVSERDAQFFTDKLLTTQQLDGEVALVRVGAEERYFDPGTPHCPFGLMNWLRTGVQGLKTTKDGGVFITTVQPKSEDATIERKGTLELDEEGTLKGKVQVVFAGLEGLRRKLSALEEDDTGRRKNIEDEIKGWLPAGAKVTLDNIAGWTGHDVPLKVDFTLEAPGFGTPAGRRLLLPTDIFQYTEKHAFPHATREHPVYFRSPFREMDELTVQVPAGYKIENVPAAVNVKEAYGQLQVTRARDGNNLKVKRMLVVDGFYYPTNWYPSLRNFFSKVRAADEEQAVLQPGQ